MRGPNIKRSIRRSFEQLSREDVSHWGTWRDVFQLMAWAQDILPKNPKKRAKLLREFERADRLRPVWRLKMLPLTRLNAPSPTMGRG